MLPLWLEVPAFIIAVVLGNAVKLLELLAQRSGVESSADNKLSPQHWLTTVARVAREITKRRKRKLRVSSLLGLH